MTRRQPFDMVKELFENEHVQLLFLFKISLFGTWLVDTMSKTSPMGSVIRAFDLQSGYQLCKGGSGNLARALFETFIAAGGRFAPQVELDRIVIEGGKATGITLKDGRTVRAKQFVASTLNVGQTFEDAIGRDQLPAAFLKKLDNFQHTTWTLYGLHLALHEPVRFKAEKFDPNLHRTLKWSLGAETMEELLAAHQDVMANRVPEIVQFGSGPLSVIDPTQAPPGKHTTYAWHVMPFAPDHGCKDYETFKAEFAERIIEKWAKYAPNMTRKNIIAQYVYTAQEYTQTFPEMRNGDIFMGSFGADQVMYNHFGYRTPVERLYMAGSACHPGGAISGGAGYISAGIIARDLGLKLWWKPWDAGEALGAIAAWRRRSERGPAAAEPLHQRSVADVDRTHDRPAALVVADHAVADASVVAVGRIAIAVGIRTRSRDGAERQAADDGRAGPTPAAGRRATALRRPSTWPRLRPPRTLRRVPQCRIS